MKRWVDRAESVVFGDQKGITWVVGREEQGVVKGLQEGCSGCAL